MLDISGSFQHISITDAGRKIKKAGDSYTEINFAKVARRSYNGRMEKEKFVEYFEEVETIEEYNGYF